MIFFILRQEAQGVWHVWQGWAFTDTSGPFKALWWHCRWWFRHTRFYFIHFPWSWRGLQRVLWWTFPIWVSLKRYGVNGATVLKFLYICSILKLNAVFTISSTSYPHFQCKAVIRHFTQCLVTPCCNLSLVCIGSMAFNAWTAGAIETELHCRMKVTALLVISVSHISQNCVCIKFRLPQFSLQTLCLEH